MAWRRKDQQERILRPQNRVSFVEAQQVSWLPATDVRPEVVGQKAYGLSAIPSAWTLPFFSISAQLHVDYRENNAAGIDKWLPKINEAAAALGFARDQKLLIRSSGCEEGMDVRGKLHTVEGTVGTIREALQSCLSRLSTDQSIVTEDVPLLVQKACTPVALRGHLSNERRCYEEARDWMGEIETVDTQVTPAFKINIRHWRQKILPDINAPLNCRLSHRISETLKVPAEWAYSLNTRVHFEWVWDGGVIYLVQADEELQQDGLDPEDQYQQTKYKPISLDTRLLRLVKGDDADAKRFAKARNIFTYFRLKLPTAPLYILDDHRVIEQLSNGVIPSEIRKDISQLVEGSLVIRTDLATEELAKRQLLPRTQELRDVDTAIDWLTKQSRTLLQAGVPSAFLFHNFIPSISSAFAYASPGEPIVQIEGLWGLPEGLYYNSHDKFVVDTGRTDVQVATAEAKILERFALRSKANFKRYYVAPDKEGKWQTFALKPNFDWKLALSDSQCRYIAYHSRRIAEAENKPVSIMWFVGVPHSMAAEPMIPWYHEEFDPSRGQSSITSRTKTVFDRGFVVRTANDVVILNSEQPSQTPLRRIRVQPQEESLLRDKSTLKRIGEAAKKHDAVIVLEGAVLSHAFYQLLQTGAIVEVVHPFEGFEERVVFNKLVRDKIPDIIKARKEIAVTVSLTPEAHIKALREKLVEEAYELLDATDLDSILSELADVETVLRTLRELYGISSDKLEEEIFSKKQERGGFDNGIVLLKTENVLPTEKENKGAQLQLTGLDASVAGVPMLDEHEFTLRTSSIDKRIDKRVSAGCVELSASAYLPVTKRTWTIQTKVDSPVKGSKSIISGEVRAERVASQLEIEVIVKIHEPPPDFFPKADGTTQS